MYAKYFVYAGGRWREVETASGRVAGWRERARFLFASRGRLVAARQSVVLKALKALAAGAPTAVKDGRRLSYTKCVSIQESNCRLKSNTCQHCCKQGCRNIIQSNSITNKAITTRSTSPFAQADLVTTINSHALNVQPQLTEKSRDIQLRRSDLSNSDGEVLSKRKDTKSTSNTHDKARNKQKSHSPQKSKSVYEKSKSGSSSSDEEILTQRKVCSRPSFKTKINSLNKPTHAKLRKAKVTSRSDNNHALQSKRTHVTNTISKSKLPSPKKFKSMKRKSSVTTSNSDGETLHSKVSRIEGHKRSISKPLVPSSERSRPSKRKRSISSTQCDDSLTSSSSSTDSKKRRLCSVKLKPSPLKRSQTRSSTSSNSSSNLFTRNNRKLRSRIKTKTSVPVTTSDEAHVEKPKYSQEMNIFSQRPVQRDRKQPNSEHIKELIIDEDDVALLRSFLIRCSTDVVIHRFDADDKYKRDIFFRINPLVDVERCKQIEEMLKKKLDEVSLKDFASQLGLCTVSECSSQSRRYQTRKSLNRHKKYKENSSQSEDTDKENISEKGSQPYKGLCLFGKAVKASEKPERVLKATHREARILNNSDKVLEKKTSDVSKANVLNRNRRKRDQISDESSVSEEDNEVGEKMQDMPKRSEEKKTVVQSTHTSSKPPVHRRMEYSNKEDHAIVAWVSLGRRANCVKGNRLWRELQDQYTAITGQARTWHSLRNRYLRYILPQLGSLALQPSHAARLRAAAATGEMKSRKLAQRRNSIFATPSANARGAWSRRPRPPPAPANTPAGGGAHEQQDDTAKQSSPVKRRLRSSYHSPSSSKSSSPSISPSTVTGGTSTPRYSDVTRRFAERHKERSTPRGSPAASQPPSKADRPADAPRTRRLYNPKVML